MAMHCPARGLSAAPRRRRHPEPEICLNHTAHAYGGQVAEAPALNGPCGQRLNYEAARIFNVHSFRNAFFQCEALHAVSNLCLLAERGDHVSAARWFAALEIWIERDREVFARAPEVSR